MIDPTPVTLRRAWPGDAPALERLAQLDSSTRPAGRVLVAEVDGELHAAISLDDGAVVANPFRRTATLVELLRARARQLEAPSARRGAHRIAARTLRRIPALSGR
ncbi:MAG: hypothetical protein ACRDLP_14420 [Solirubrobacteraceae bacterium]